MLIGENLAVILDILETKLANFHFNVVAICNSKHDVLREYVEKKPHVTLLDLELQGGRGLETLKALHALNPKAPIVILTDTPSKGSVLLAKKYGARDYISVHASPDRMRTTLRSVCPVRQARLAQCEHEKTSIRELVERLDQMMFKDLPERAPPEISSTG